MAYTAKVIKNMFSCTICFANYDEEDFAPLSQPCGHTACKRCWFMIVNDVPVKKCFTCRGPVTPENARPNYAILDMIRGFNEMDETVQWKAQNKNWERLCKDCKREFPKRELFTCLCDIDALLCKGCFDAHDRRKHANENNMMRNNNRETSGRIYPTLESIGVSLLDYEEDAESMKAQLNRVLQNAIKAVNKMSKQVPATTNRREEAEKLAKTLDALLDHFTDQASAMEAFKEQLDVLNAVLLRLGPTVNRPAQDHLENGANVEGHAGNHQNVADNGNGPAPVLDMDNDTDEEMDEDMDVDDNLANEPAPIPVPPQLNPMQLPVHHPGNERRAENIQNIPVPNQQHMQLQFIPLAAPPFFHAGMNLPHVMPAMMIPIPVPHQLGPMHPPLQHPNINAHEHILHNLRPRLNGAAPQAVFDGVNHPHVHVLALNPMPAREDQMPPAPVNVISQHGLLKPEIQMQLQSALKWFEQAIYVEPLETILTVAIVKEKVDDYKGNLDSVTVQTPNKALQLKFNDEDVGSFLAKADHTVVIIKGDDEKCSDDSFLAAVEPKFVISGDRPHMSTMEYCDKGYEKDFNYFDLFRHEIFHGLGYGTMNSPLFGREEAPKSQYYDWRFEDGKMEMATRTFLKYGSTAVEEVKKHFGCDQHLEGVEAEYNGHHLNEYIFGNELMTPELERKENFFSHISANVLENTWTSKRWYQVNRTFIHPEASKYNYGKDFGCDFLLKSCFDFIAAKKSTNKFLLPFCTGEEDKCVQLASGVYKIECNPGSNAGVYLADNGISEPANSRYHNVKYRFCPVISFFSFLSEYKLVPCPT
ncbi:unnamed protein product [Caenorhabditis sp. 36 PRJEB53466]|nr:unnamed protein product [Caenorhabditis sp. 36 PRJEB53466]